MIISIEPYSQGSMLRVYGEDLDIIIVQWLNHPLNKINMLVNFGAIKCGINLLKYQNNRPAIELVDAITGEPAAIATVNLPDVPLLPNEVIIKDYSENKGMYQALLDADVILPTHRSVDVGLVVCPITFLKVQENN